jgi:hypothetical protein
MKKNLIAVFNLDSVTKISHLVRETVGKKQKNNYIKIESSRGI